MASAPRSGGVCTKTAVQYFGTVVSASDPTIHRSKSHYPKSAARTSSSSTRIPPSRVPGLSGLLTTY